MNWQQSEIGKIKSISSLICLFRFWRLSYEVNWEMRDCCWGMYVDLFRLRLIFVTFDNKTSEKLYSLRYGNSYVVTISNANFIIFIIYLFIYYFFMVVFFWGGGVFVCLFVKLFLFLFFLCLKCIIGVFSMICKTLNVRW